MDIQINGPGGGIHDRAAMRVAALLASFLADYTAQAEVRIKIEVVTEGEDDGV